jgi:16S rRNA (adenine1518-N6/adenine1519-N6)-dimethyltransferase
MRRRRRLGQHYLVDVSTINRIVEVAAIQRTENVIEIGTGRGALTRVLVGLTDNLQGYEVDLQSYLELANELGHNPHLGLHNSDAFESTSEFDVLVSSLPYSESSTLIDWLSQRTYNRAVLVLQEDFARKLIAQPGDEAYRAVSVIAQVCSQIDIVSRVDRLSFEPPPRVNSCVVTMRHLRSLTSVQVGMIKRLFSQKRRKLGAALKALRLALPPPYRRDVRVNMLRPEDVLLIASHAADAAAGKT